MPEESAQQEVSSEVPITETAQSKETRSQKGVYIGFGVLLVVVLTLITIGMSRHSSRNENGGGGPRNGEQQQASDQNQNTPLDSNSSDPIQKGRLLSNNLCMGTGSKTLTSQPLATSDIGVIAPMGNMIGGHVTPIDHEYYYQKDPAAARDTYPVMAPADGQIVDIQHRSTFIGNADDAPKGATDEYRIVISYSCTFFSYYDLVTGLDKSVSVLLPADFATTGRIGNKAIPVKAGQVIAHVGGQSLDFAVWDTTKPVTGLINPIAFNNAEAWKMVTVPPLNYWSNEVKTAILPFYVRQAEPRDGKFDYDVDGTAIGDWFLAGTNGYRGGTSQQPTGNYFAGHLALAPDAIDPTACVFSVGRYNGGDATQFAIVGNTPDPATVTPATGLVKYTLAQFDHALPNGQMWTGSTPASGITVKAGIVKAVALIQMLDRQTLKVEVFPGKTTSDGVVFDDKAQTYDRGQGATIIN